jgi:apolipoprotein N-acyltransferase
MITMTGQGSRPDLIVWPETAVPYLLNHVHGDLVLMAEAARGAPLVFGIQRRDENLHYYNSLVVMGQGGALRSTYDKRHLVPFGEYIPGGDLLGQFGIHGLATSDGAGFAAGSAPPRITIPGIGDAVPMICYEGIFAEEIGVIGDRPRLLLLITNDAWFGAAAGPLQHLAQARLRAIEQGLPMVRVANTGVSAMIDPYGRIVASLPLNSHGALDVALPAAHAATVYARFSDWLLFGMLTFVTLGGYLVQRRDSD